MAIIICPGCETYENFRKAEPVNNLFPKREISVTDEDKAKENGWEYVTDQINSENFWICSNCIKDGKELLGE